MRAEVDVQWEEATPEVKEHYGKDYFYKWVRERTEGNSCPTPDPVLNAIEDALLNINPQPRYLVPGGDFLFDKFAVCYFLVMQACFKMIKTDVNFSRLPLYFFSTEHLSKTWY